MRTHLLTALAAIAVSLAANAQQLTTDILAGSDNDRHWRLAKEAGSIRIGSSQGADDLYSISQEEVDNRYCLFDDAFRFENSGNFWVDNWWTWLDTWTGVDQVYCDNYDVLANDFTVFHQPNGSYLISTDELTVTGTGAYIGLPVAYNGGEYSQTNMVVQSQIVYDILSVTSDVFYDYVELGIDVSANLDDSRYYTFKMQAVREDVTIYFVSDAIDTGEPTNSEFVELLSDWGYHNFRNLGYAVESGHGRFLVVNEEGGEAYYGKNNSGRIEEDGDELFVSKGYNAFYWNLIDNHYNLNSFNSLRINNWGEYVDYDRFLFNSAQSPHIFIGKNIALNDGGLNFSDANYIVNIGYGLNEHPNEMVFDGPIEVISRDWYEIQVDSGNYNIKVDLRNLTFQIFPHGTADNIDFNDSYDSLYLSEDIALELGLDTIFADTTGGSLTYTIRSLSGGAPANVEIVKTDVSNVLTITPHLNESGNFTIDLGVAQEDLNENSYIISVFINPIGDGPQIDSTKIVQDLIRDQFEGDSTLAFDLNIFEDPEEDTITLAVAIANLSESDASFTSLTETDYELVDGILSLNLISGSKYHSTITYSATSKGEDGDETASADFDLVIDNAPSIDEAFIVNSGTLLEEFDDVTFKVDEFTQDDDSDDLAIEISFPDYGDGAGGILLYDTLKIAGLSYDTNDSSVTITSKENATGEVAFIFDITSGPRTVVDTLVFAIDNVDDSVVLKNNLGDQIVAIDDTEGLDIDISSVFFDIDGAVNFDNVTVSTVPVDQTLFTVDAASLPVLNVKAEGAPEDSIEIVLTYADGILVEDIADTFYVTAIQAFNTWYVNGTDGDDANDGSEITPFKTIQYAIDAASIGDNIIVAAGDYEENIIIEKRLSISSTYDGTDEQVIEDTKIIAADSATVITVNEVDGLIIEGFTVTGGLTGPAGAGPDSRGAGLYVNNSSVTFNNLYIMGNEIDPESEFRGAGIVFDNSQGKRSTLNGVLIRENGNGSGIVLDDFTTLAIDKSRIRFNGSTAVDSETVGGIWCTSSELIITNSIIESNYGDISNNILLESASNFTINHALIGTGEGDQNILIKDLNNDVTGLIQNSLFNGVVKGSSSNITADKLTIENNILKNVEWDVNQLEVDLFGANNQTGLWGIDPSGEGLSDLSIALGKGKSTSLTDDILGNTRPDPDGTNPDIGPFESPLSAPVLAFPQIAGPVDGVHVWQSRSFKGYDVGDFDKDGYSEIVTLRNNGNGYDLILTTSSNTLEVIKENIEYNILKSMDLDADGDLDFVAIQSASKVDYYFNNGDLTFTVLEDLEIPGNVETWRMREMTNNYNSWGDITGDGRMDFIIPMWSSVTVVEFKVDHIITRSIDVQSNDGSYPWLGDIREARCVDIDLDGNIDLVVRNTWNENEVNDFLFFKKVGDDFEFQSELALYNLPKGGNISMLTADFDSNGNIDLAIASDRDHHDGINVDGFLKFYELNPDSSRWIEMDLRVIKDELDIEMDAVGDQFSNLKVVDINYDGKLDLLAFHSENESNDSRMFPALFINNGDWEFKYQYTFFNSISANIWDFRDLSVGNFEEDGILDIVVLTDPDVRFFKNDLTIQQADPADPTNLVLDVKGSRVTINAHINTPYYSIEVCKDAICNSSLVRDQSALVHYPALYEVGDSISATLFLTQGDYTIKVYGIDHAYQVTSEIASEISVDGISFSSGQVVFNDFFNSVNLINIDTDDDPEFYGFKKRYWDAGGEVASKLKIFSFGDPGTSNDFVLDQTGQAPLLSDLDQNGLADIIVDNGNWNSRFFSLLNIDETSSVSEFSSSFTETSILYEGNGRSSDGVFANNLVMDIDQDGSEEIVTYASGWDENSYGFKLFGIDGKDITDEKEINLFYEDVRWVWDEATQNSFEKYAYKHLFDFKVNSDNELRGMDMQPVDLDLDGDEDYLLVMNGRDWSFDKPLSHLIAVEFVHGKLIPHYLASFIDRSVLDIEIIKDGNDQACFIIGLTDRVNYYGDAFNVGFMTEFSRLDIAKSGQIFENFPIRTTREVVDYRNHTIPGFTFNNWPFTSFEFATILETGDFNNDGRDDFIVAANISNERWNGSSHILVYLQNELGGFDPFTSGLNRDLEDIAVITSINILDQNQDGRFDLLVSGFSGEHGVTKVFLNENTTGTAVTSVPTPTSLAGRNNGYKLSLNWTGDEGSRYAVQIGTELDNYNISSGNLNASGYPLFPDRPNVFVASESITVDAYDLADKYYFRVKAINKYGMYSDFSAVAEVTLEQPFVLDNQDIPGFEDGAVAWGDYDRDGDLDLAVMGRSEGFKTFIYRNDDGIFINSNQALEPMARGDIEWVDYNNDGYLDLFVVGENIDGDPTTIFYENENGLSFVRNFSIQNIQGVTSSTAAFGDVDGDGDMDLALAGFNVNENNYTLRLYNNLLNQGSPEVFQEERNFHREGFFSGDIIFADFDNDGDQDMVYTGSGLGGNPVGGLIVNSKVGITSEHYFHYQGELALKDAALDVGDLDLDGDLDIIATGTRSFNDTDVPVTRILENESFKIDSVRSDLRFIARDSEVLAPLSNGDIDLADFDNDGDLDVVLTGEDDLNNPVTRLYARSGASYFEVNAGLTDMTQSIVKWGDFDVDGDMDLFLSGKAVSAKTEIYRNNTGELVNLPPSVPDGLTMRDEGYGKVILSWSRPEDDFTPKNTLSYIVSLGTSAGSSDIFTTESDLTTGYRLTPKPSSALQNFRYLELDPGTYYWSVQAVDANYSGSVFSQVQTFTLSYDWKALNLGGIVDNSLPGGENSTTKFADIDNDGDFDLTIFGKTNFKEPGIFMNNNGVFQRIDWWFDQITKGDFDWADIDGDGMLDLFFTGEDIGNELNKFASLHLNRTFDGNVGFESYYGFPALVNAKVKFTDLDNDGIPELIYGGSTLSNETGKGEIYIYTFESNEGFLSFEEISLANELPQLSNSSLDFGDFDLDSDIDVVITGESNQFGRQALILVNDGLNEEDQLELTETSFNLIGVRNGTSDFIDYDNDGDLDLIVSGDATQGDALNIYENREGAQEGERSFVNISATVTGLKPLKNGKTSWGDFNGDGYADMVYSGEVIGEGDFTGLAVYDPLANVFRPDEFDLSEFVKASVAFGDYDGDDDLDMVLSGEFSDFQENDPYYTKYLSRIYVNERNQSAALAAAGGRTTSAFLANTPPTTPTTISAAIKTDAQAHNVNHHIVQFSWNPASDDQTAAPGLTYALRIGSDRGKDNVLPSGAKLTGRRLVSGKGNVEHNTSWNMELAPGTYYWSVQSIDPSYSSSAFSAEQVLIIDDSGLVTNNSPIAGPQSFQVKELSEQGTVVGNVDASDPENDPLAYAIIGGDEDSVFTINAQGEIIVERQDALVISNIAEFILTVQISDGFSTTEITITITLVTNLSPSAIAQTFELEELSEQGTIVGTIDVTDPENDVLTFEIIGGDDAGVFSVNSAGEVVVEDQAALLIVNQAEYELTIRISDGTNDVDVIITISLQEKEALALESEFVRRIYPVPADKRLNIVLRRPNEVFTVEVYDISGSSVLSIDKVDTRIPLDIRNLKPGVYVLTLDTSDGAERIKFIKN